MPLLTALAGQSLTSQINSGVIFLAPELLLPVFQVIEERGKNGQRQEEAADSLIMQTRGLGFLSLSAD